MNALQLRDIDYAALAVETAFRDKFGRQTDLTDCKVSAGATTITINDRDQTVAGTRDQLLARLRRSATYAEFWND
jgi:hypothetical protein